MIGSGHNSPRASMTESAKPRRSGLDTELGNGARRSGDEPLDVIRDHAGVKGNPHIAVGEGANRAKHARGLK